MADPRRHTLVVLNGRAGPVATGDLPIYRLPGLLLELLGDRRPAVLSLAGTPPDLTIRPLPGLPRWSPGTGRAPVAARRATTWPARRRSPGSRRSIQVLESCVPVTRLTLANT
ncbi:MAG: hypothetical protein MZV65_00085 [Chromatiales bacterium]|nr:hypothetical protein [Chromatiales bacterium]